MHLFVLYSRWLMLIDCRVHDSFILPDDTVGASDHCPVGIVITP